MSASKRVTNINKQSVLHRRGYYTDMFVWRPYFDDDALQFQIQPRILSLFLSQQEHDIYATTTFLSQNVHRQNRIEVSFSASTYLLDKYISPRRMMDALNTLIFFAKVGSLAAVTYHFGARVYILPAVFLCIYVQEPKISRYHIIKLSKRYESLHLLWRRLNWLTPIVASFGCCTKWRYGFY